MYVIFLNWRHKPRIMWFTNGKVAFPQIIARTENKDTHTTYMMYTIEIQQQFLPYSSLSVHLSNIV